jgi:hypothetical protein
VSRRRQTREQRLRRREDGGQGRMRRLAAERDGGHLPMTVDLLTKERGKEGGDGRRRTWPVALDERKMLPPRPPGPGLAEEAARGPHARWE